MKKEDLRKLYRRKRKDLSPPEREKLDDLMLIQFQLLPFVIPAVVMTYAASPLLAEFDPTLIENYCLFKNPEVLFAFPKINGDEILPMLTDPETLYDTNKFGIDEPLNGIEVSSHDIGMVFVPLISFDVCGNRVGYGKGYYDRFLRTCNSETLKIGFSYFDAGPDVEDISVFDIALDYCVSPQGIYSFV